MKAKFIFLLLPVSLFPGFSGCGGEEDTPPKEPTITTNEISNITGTTATGGGEVISDGCKYYWSSTKLDNTSALRMDFLTGSTVNNGKANAHAFRPIRVF